jgi:hypothetical protein
MAKPTTHEKALRINLDAAKYKPSPRSAPARKWRVGSSATMTSSIARRCSMRSGITS